MDSPTPTRPWPAGALLGRTILEREPHGGSERRFDHVGVDADRVLEVLGIAPGEEGDNRDAAGGRRLEHKPVPRPKLLAREQKPSELILAIGIRARDVRDQLGAV